MKKILCVLLAVCLLICMIPLSASAADSGTCGDNLTWTLDDNGVLTISGTGPMTDFAPDPPWSGSEIKEVVIENGVTTIGEHAFRMFTGFSATSVNIPDSVTSIGSGAFQYCESLETVVIPNSVEEIGSYAFGMTGLTSVTIPNTITTIEAGTFYSSALASVTIPASVTEIGVEAFSGTKLTSITIPDTVTTIGEGAFYASSLTSVTIGSGVESIGSKAFLCCPIETVSIPQNVTSLGTSVFGGVTNFDLWDPDTTLKSISVDANNAAYSSADGVLYNKAGDTLLAFPAGKEVSSFTIPDNVTAIGDSAFEDCVKLSSITIPNSVTSFGSSAFTNCIKLTSIKIPKDVTSLPVGTADAFSHVFAECRALESVLVDEANTAFSSVDGVLYNYGKTELVYYPQGKTATAFTVPDGTTSIADGALFFSGIKDFTIPESVTSIGSSAFLFMPAEDITIRAVKGSYAETYAKTNSMTYVEIAAPTPTTYTVRFDADGGTLTGDASQTVTAGQTATKPTDPTRTDYTFKHWSETKGGATAFNFSTAIAKDITLYAVWEKNSGGNEGGDEGGTTNPPVVNPPVVNPPVDDPADEPDTPVDPPEFKDVPADAYYADAVAWAVENGITEGVSEDEFAPNASCTRAQAVTFLWRAAGSPKVEGATGFSDVSENAYYADAVKWAVANGITQGMGNGKFSPNAICDRAQIVTFMYRAENSPAVSGGTSFGDVDSNDYYNSAVQWAVQNGITQGTTTTSFSPDNDCVRAQIVTFLYRGAK